MISLYSVENPTRTAQFLAMMEERRRDLRERHARVLPPKTTFTWEIGCGHGHFLTAYAQAHPQEICIGVDIVSDRIERAVKKRDRAKLANLHFIHAEARLFLETLPPDTTFSRLFVLFPDPWPKARHHKHRIMQPDFLADAAKRAGEGARLYFRTDFTPYYTDTKGVFESHPDWTLLSVEGAPGNETWPYERETVFQSRAAAYHSLVAGLKSRPAIV
ncbi:MAG: tRNA (guanosine(46)-N7)-methyltransferase TrmB [Verrucomicrobia bacterium]|nr:tRNA (guanosine(46)-N7)-methyltransferase TrmB [Verrucomicrobiota bacterium]